MKKWITAQPTKYGIREKLLAEGLISGTREYVNRYAQEWHSIHAGFKNEYQQKYYFNNREKILKRRNAANARARVFNS